MIDDDYVDPKLDSIKENDQDVALTPAKIKEQQYIF